MASPAHELADFTSPRVLITVRGWPEQVCPVTNEHLSTLLTALQKVGCYIASISVEYLTSFL